MKKAYRITVALIALTMVLLLTGCAKLNSYVQDEVKKASEEEIKNSSEYQQYENTLSNEASTEENMSSVKEPDGEPVDPNAVQVTIATNTFLDCKYYTDKEKEPRKASKVFLAPGDSLYAAGVSVNNDKSNLYDFSCFRIWSYDRNGKRSSSPYGEIGSRDGIILTVPESFEGTGFSVEPLGAYSKRHITVRAYYLKDGETIDLPNGNWKVNDEAFLNSIDISPVESYTITYDYGKYEGYYCINSAPAYWYVNEREHVVIFREVSSDEQKTEFSVEMHPFITMNVTNSCINLVSGLPLIGNHGDQIIQSITKKSATKDEVLLNQDDWDKQTFEIKQLRVGDQISIRVGKEYKITGDGINVGTAIPLGSDAESGYEYTIVVPDTMAKIGIHIEKRNSDAEGTYQGYNIANADVMITRTNGVPLKLGDEKPGDEEKVTVTITPRDGYYIEGFTEKNGFSFVKKNIKYAKLEKDIITLLKDHPARKFISLNLVLDDEFGLFEYKLDGEDVKASILNQVRTGQTLKAVYTANSDCVIGHSWFGANVFHKVVTLTGGNDSIAGSIKITDEMDGTTIDRETFGIAVEKKG